MKTLTTGVGGFVLGVAAARFLDPRAGARRRAEVVQKSVHAAHKAADAAGKSSRDLRNRSRGLWHAIFAPEGPVDDAVLVERVRSRLGRVCSHPGALEVSAAGGCVVLRGPVLASEYKAACVGGVMALTEELELHKQPDDVPALQGGTRHPLPRPELLQENWAPGIRVLMGAASAGLIGLGAARRDLPGSVIAGCGVLLLARSATNLPVRRLIGVRAGRRGIDVQKSVVIAAAPEELYGFFMAAENFPRFMEHVRDVRVTGEGQWHWRVAGPAGVEVEWDAEVTRAEPGRLLSWATVETAPVESFGTVRFVPVDGGTRVDVRLSYNPPLGAVGHAVAALLGADPKQQLDDDLLRLKSLLERGKPSGDEERAARDRLS
ncbi:MAG: SRPBCC family protein [Deltaproteobacteria bacterium]|nr:MAG: SRPBCC family protein [Deltaproteobacteria bacterium]